MWQISLRIGYRALVLAEATVRHIAVVRGPQDTDTAVWDAQRALKDEIRQTFSSCFESEVSREMIKDSF